MDQDIDIINSQTRNEKIKNFFIESKKSIIGIFVTIIILIISYFIYEEFEASKIKQISNKYNLALIKYEKDNSYNVAKDLKEIIGLKDKTYSPLAFYFLLDNDLITSKSEINNYFDIIIEDLNLEKNFKELSVLKKGIYNSDFIEENDLLNILNPIIKNDSIWKSHALYLMGEYYLFNNQKNKAKQFFEKTVETSINNPKIKANAQKKLRSSFSD
tara:strand:+ start:276 stop:920 length:645 start_codon:yes stop_codon:yes gene_type:complete